MKKNHLTPAIAMIELIFSLVVMGIVMMSAPLLLTTTQNSTTIVLQQEGVNQAVSRATMLLDYPWDENDTNASCTPPVLHVTNGDTELDPMLSDPTRRAGVPVLSNSRKFNTCSKEFNASLTLGMEAGETVQDDMDDFGTTSLTPIQNQGGRYIGKDDITIATTITYGSDSIDYTKGKSADPIFYTPSAGVATSNIKIIDVNITTFSQISELKNSIIMRAFSCNIGGISYETRNLP